MNRIITVIILIVLSITKIDAQKNPGLAKDTLGWLQTHIQADSNYYKGKPFKVLYDSLYGLKNKLYSFKHPFDQIGIAILDSTPAETISIFFGDLYSAKVWPTQDSMERANWANGVNWRDGPIPTVNTHLIYIQVEFTNPKMYNFHWEDTDRYGLGAFEWNAKLANFFSTCIVKSVIIDEY